MRTKLVVAALVLAAAAGLGLLYLLSLDRASVSKQLEQLSAPAVAVLSEALVRQALGSAAGVRVDWDEVALSLAPLSVTLSGVEAEWSSEPAVVARAARVVLRPALAADGGLLESDRLEIVSARFEGLRIERRESSLARQLLDLRELEVWRGASAASGPSVDDGLRGAREGSVGASGVASLPAVSGRGEFQQGGALSFQFHGALRALESRGRREPAGAGAARSAAKDSAAGGHFAVEAHFSDVPADNWASLVPELRDSSGTIAGSLWLEALRDEDGRHAVGEARPASGLAPIVGRFEIDATGAGLSLAGAYRKPVGDPASITGRFTASPHGEFELLEVHLSIRKQRGERK